MKTTSLNLARGVSTFFATGILYTVHKRTGEVRPISADEFERAEKAGVLDGFHVRLDLLAAESKGAEIRNRLAGSN